MLSRLLYVAVTFGLVLSAGAQPSKAPAVFDTVSRKAFDRWKTVEYHPGREGVKKVRFKFSARVVGAGQPQPATNSAVYLWDGAKGKLTWSNPARSRIFEGLGWTVEIFSQMFDDKLKLKRLDGCSLTGKQVGEDTVVSVARPSGSGIKQFTFDKRGVMVSMTLGSANVSILFDLTYRQVGAKFLGTGWRYVYTPVGRGKIVSKVVFEHAKSGGYYLLSKVVEKATEDDKQLFSVNLEFSGHTLNDAVK